MWLQIAAICLIFVNLQPNIDILMANNKRLGKAKTGKNDEFYTQLSDIENELRHYKAHFQGKTVLCNCDDPRVSNFTKYFILNFRALGLKKLITTCYKNQDIDLFSTNSCEKAVYMVYTGTENSNSIPTPEEIGVKELKGDGDFRSAECIELLKEADIVVTNPPFSLFREYVAQLIKYDKKFIIIGHQNAITYKEFYPYLISGQIWAGYGFNGMASHFISKYDDVAVAGNHKEGMIRVSGVMWFTNLEIQKRHEPFICIRDYNPEDYPTFGNFKKCIFVKEAVNIPSDYNGLMAVPISFLEKFSPDQFDFVAMTNDSNWLKENGATTIGNEIIYKARSQGNKSHITANMYSLYYISQKGKIEFPYARMIIKKK